MRADLFPAIVERVKAYRSRRFIQYTNDCSAGETSISRFVGDFRTGTHFCAPQWLAFCLFYPCSVYFRSATRVPLATGTQQEENSSFDNEVKNVCESSGTRFSIV